MTITLTPEHERIIQAQIATGQFRSADEVLDEGFRLLEQREQDDRAKLEWLRAAATEGFDQLDCGDYTAVSSDEELETFLKGIRQEVSAERADRQLG